MKICDLTQFYSPVSGGVRRYLERKASYIRENFEGGCHVLVVPGRMNEVSGDDICRVYTIASPLVSRTSRYRVLLRLHLVEEILERERPDIIESGDPYQLAWKAVASGRALGIPVAGFYHSHFPEAILRTLKKFTSPGVVQIAEDATRRYVRSLYNHFVATFVPSPALAALLASWGVGRLYAIDLGVDSSIFRPCDEGREGVRQRLGVCEGEACLLYVGRLSPEKNLATLFEAFEMVCEERRCRLVVVGDGSLRGSVLNLRARRPVTWIPYCDDPKELAGIYRAADLFVHPGIQETFGLVILESQACGTPVVGIRGSYMDRIVLSDQLNWARENSSVALAEAILCCLESSDRQAAQEVSRKVREKFSWESAFARILGIYREVI